MTGLGTIGVAEALKNYLTPLFPNFYVYRSCLGIDAIDSAVAIASGKPARIAIVPESSSIDPTSRGKLARQTILNLVVVRDLAPSAASEATFAPFSEVDPMIVALDDLAELFTEKARIFESNGVSADVYLPEARLSSELGLFDPDQLAKGRFLGSLQVSVFEKVARC